MNNIINASKNNNLINKEKNRNFKNNNNMNNSIHYKTNDIIIPNIVSNPATLYRLKKEFELCCNDIDYEYWMQFWIRK